MAPDKITVEFLDAFARYLGAPADLPPQRNAVPNSNNDEAGAVAATEVGIRNGPAVAESCDTLAGASDSASTSAQLQPVRNESATSEPLPRLEGDGVADETPRAEEAEGARPAEAAAYPSDADVEAMELLDSKY